MSRFETSNVERRTFERPNSRDSTLAFDVRRSPFAFRDETKTARRDGLHGLLSRSPASSGSTFTTSSACRRLGHDVYYIEDSARLPYNPVTFEVNNELRLRREHPSRSSRRIRLSKSLGFLRALSPGQPDAGLPLKKIRATLPRGRRHPECVRHAGIQRRPAGERADSLHRKRPGAGADQSRLKADKATIKYLRRHHALFTFGENVGTERFPGADAQFEMAADAPAGRHGFLENQSPSPPRAAFHLGR